MSRASLVKHYEGLRMTRADLTEQLVSIELAGIESLNKANNLEGQLEAEQAKSHSLQVQLEGYQFDVERMTEQRDELRKRFTEARDERHQAVDTANGQVQELQKLVAYLREDLDTQRGWRRHLRDQRNEALGIIQGMRNDIDTIADAPSKLDQLLEKLQREPEPYIEISGRPIDTDMRGRRPG